MNEKINERKNIIISFKLNLGKNKKGIDRKILILKLLITGYLAMIIMTAGRIALSIIAEILGYEIYKWEKLGLLVVLSLSFVMIFPNQFYGLKLLKHLKKINSKSDFKGIDKLNNDLKIIIDKLNNPLKNIWSLITLVIVIVILTMGVHQVLSENKNNTYWNYMKLPVLLFYGIILYHFIFMNRKLSKNIRETEKYCG